MRVVRTGSLLAAAAVILFFWWTDDPLLSEETRRSGEAEWLRVTWISLVLAAAALSRWAPVSWAGAVGLLAGGGSAVVMTRISALTAGTAGPNFAWLVAFPFLAATIAAEATGAVALTGFAIVVGGGAIAIAQHGATEMGALWVVTLAVAAGLGVLVSLRHHRDRRRTALAQQRQAEAAAALELSIRRQSDMARMMHAEELATLGRMTAGVAHDLRNHMATLAMSVPQLQESVDPAEKREIGADIDVAIRGITDILRGMSDLSKPNTGSDARCEVGAVLDICRRLTRHRWRHLTGELRIERPDTPVVVAMGETPLVQVVVNLIINALDACEEHPAGGPHVVVVELHTDADHAEIRVDDSGPGFAPEIAATAFDAFVTTKPEERGTGLGLAVCRATVAAARGEMSACASVLGGARVVARLPLAAPAEGARAG